VLLIEAALQLPKWLEPDTSENRVFVADGKLQIVPPPSLAPASIGLPADPTLSQALAIVRASVLARRGEAPPGAITAATEASGDVQRAISHRIQGYPAAAISEARHRAFCRVPSSVAQLLHVQPQLVSAAVRCFYQRGPEELKSASAMRRFGKDPWVILIFFLAHICSHLRRFGQDPCVCNFVFLEHRCEQMCASPSACTRK